MEVRSLVKFKKSDSQIAIRKKPNQVIQKASHPRSYTLKHQSLIIKQRFGSTNWNFQSATVKMTQVGRLGTDLNLFSLLLQRLHRSICQAVFRWIAEGCLKPTGSLERKKKKGILYIHQVYCKMERIRFSCCTLHTFKQTYCSMCRTQHVAILSTTTVATADTEAVYITD